MNKTGCVILLYILIGSAACNCKLLADEWPQWRGPTRDDVGKETQGFHETSRAN